MVAGIEFGKDYAQICVQTEHMAEPESLSLIAGREHYRIPAEGDPGSREGMQYIFRRFLKLLKPYGNAGNLKYLVCIPKENTEETRALLLETAQIYNIPSGCVHFLDRKESFCVYLFHSEPELLAHNALLIGSDDGEKTMLLLHRQTGTLPAVAQVRDIFGETPENVLAQHSISSVFLVGDFEEEWLNRYLKLLKSGRRVFAGQNLYVKGACYRAAELLSEEKNRYLYVGEETLCVNIALNGGEKELVTIVEGGRNWYESDVTIDVLLLSGTELEFFIIPIGGKGQTAVTVPLDALPERPPKSTRLRIMLKFVNKLQAKLTVRDLGFGELYPQSDMVYEGELRWEQ